jgi:ankyrin repeat protein
MDIIQEDKLPYDVEKIYIFFQEGDHMYVKKLLDKELDVNISLLNTDISEYGSLLNIAIKNKHITLVELLLSYGANVNSMEGEIGRAPLHWAAVDFPDVVELLLSYGANVNLADIGGKWTPLHYASYEGNLPLVKLLIKHGADIHAMSESGRSPFTVAIMGGGFSVIEFLLEQGAEFIISSDIDPLFTASLNGYVEILDLCFNRKKINLNSKTYESGQTLLHISSSRGHVEVVKFLLNKGANPNLIDDNGQTPLHLSAFKGNLEAVKYLLSKGADANLMDKDGLTALHAAFKYEKIAIVEYLLEYGVYDTNLHFSNAQITEHFKMNKQLLKIGVENILKNQHINHKQRLVLKTFIEDHSSVIEKIYPKNIKEIFINNQRSRVSDLATYYLNKLLPLDVYQEITSFLKIKDIDSLQIALVETLLKNRIKVKLDIADKVTDIFINSPNLLNHDNPKIMAILVNNAIDNKYPILEITQYLKKIEFNSESINSNIETDNYSIFPNNIDMQLIVSNIQQGLRIEPTIRYFLKIFNIEFPEFYLSNELKVSIDFICGVVNQNTNKPLSYILLDTLSYYAELKIYEKLNEHNVVASPTNLMSLADACGAYIVYGGVLGLSHYAPVMGMINGAAICMEKHHLFEKEFLFETSLRLGLDISIGIYMLYQNVAFVTAISAVVVTDITTKVIFSGFDLLVNSLNISPMILIETTPFSTDLRTDSTYLNEFMQYEINPIGDHIQLVNANYSLLVCNFNISSS